MDNQTASENQYATRLRSEYTFLRSKKKEIALVAGVAGFVGSRIAEMLIDAGLTVIGIDNYVSGKQHHLENLVNRDEFELIESDLQQGVVDGVREKKPQYVIDALNVYPHIGRTEFGLNELLNNSISLKNLLLFANEVKARFVYTSSVDIYQGLASHEYLQNYYDGRELTTYYEYLEGKRYGEALCREYVENYQLDVRIARIPEVYGPRMDLSDSSLLSRAARLALEGKDLIFDEEGSRQHQLIYVDDLVYGVLKLIFSNDDKMPGAIFYFVNPEPVSTLSIAYTLREIVQQDVRVEFLPQHQKVGFPEPQKVDISRTMRYLRWSPQVDLTLGLERTLSWFKENVRKNRPSSPKTTPAITVDGSVETDEEQQVPPTMTIESTDFSPQADNSGVEAKLKEKASKTSRWLEEKVPEVEASPPLPVKKKNKLDLTPARLLLKAYWVDALLGFGLFIIVALLPLILSGVFILRAKDDVEKGEYAKAEIQFRQASSFFQYYGTPAGWLGLGEKHAATLKLLDAGVYGSRLASDLTDVATDLAPVANTLETTLLGSNEAIGYSRDELSKMQEKAVLDLRSAQGWMTLLTQKLDEIDVGKLPGFISLTAQKADELAFLADPMLEHANELVAQLDMILGFDEPQRYLVLLQNNNEIRPTGGFPGSYAALTIDKGKITDFKVDDVYNPDGLLTQDSSPLPPAVLTKHLDIGVFGMRDTNFWVDFPTGAADAVTLYNRATNEGVDGVIGLNALLVEELLRVTGPVRVESLDKTITAENFAEQAQIYAEIDFEPGSTNKKDFLGAITNQMLVTLVAHKDEYGASLLAVLGKQLLSGNIQFYFNDAFLQRTAQEAQIAGQLLTSDSDFLSVIDTNLSGNKANYWVTRQTAHTIDVDRNGDLKATTTVTWRNDSPGDSWPGGEYINYVRVYVPKGSVVTDVTPQLDDYTVGEMFGYTEVAGVIKVSPQEDKTLTVTYVLPRDLNVSTSSTYELLWQPQPGILDEQVVFTFNVPGFLSTSDAASVTRRIQWPFRINLAFSAK